MRVLHSVVDCVTRARKNCSLFVGRVLNIFRVLQPSHWEDRLLLLAQSLLWVELQSSLCIIKAWRIWCPYDTIGSHARRASDADIQADAEFKHSRCLNRKQS